MSINISKENRDSLLEKLEEIRAYVKADGNTDRSEKLLGYLTELEQDINGKKYGLVFEEHQEEIEKLLVSRRPVLVEDKELYLNRGGEINELIEGDNLASLMLLEEEYPGQIDLIYIDPPYNRGKTDFIYDDDYVGSKDVFRHSKWTSFMKKRLLIARKLLSDTGLIFISIDDNEVASLRLLCDEIFGEEQFINMFIWKRNSSVKTEKDKFTVNTEYVLLYGKTPRYVLHNAYKPLSAATAKMYNKDDHDGRGPYATVSLQKPRDPGPETSYDYVDNTGKVWPCPPKGWRMIQSKVKALENDNRLYMKGKSLRVKDYWNERVNKGKRIDTLWDDISENSAGSKELERALGRKNSFDNPKPLGLIARCLKIGGKNDTVLDFFAGSGTTGHAVMKLNAEDGGSRRFILCTSNENNICRDVTYARLENVIEKEGYVASLKYKRIVYEEPKPDTKQP